MRSGSGKTVVFELAMLRFFSSELLRAGKDQLKPSLARTVHEQQEQLDAMGDGDEVDMTGGAASALSSSIMMQKKKWQPKKAIYIAPLKSDNKLQEIAACLPACLPSTSFVRALTLIMSLCGLMLHYSRCCFFRALCTGLIKPAILQLDTCR